MIYIFLSILFGNLTGYSVTADQGDLDYLYENFLEELEIPAVLHLDTLDIQCTLAFRGGTSLWCIKKSWHIRLDDETLFPWGNHILLNAQFRDPSLMRNTLGLMMTRELGFPAPETEFVTLEINGSNMGVFERVERVDRFFYERNGTGFGPLFKNTDVMGRLACQYADTSSLAGIEPKVDSQPYSLLLLRLIENCFTDDVTSFDTEEVLALFAVNSAISDHDGLIKNVYYHLYQDCWHIYPWDRDATFGNSWEGDYDSTWVEKHSLNDIGYFGGARGFLQDSYNTIVFNGYLADCSVLMQNRFPDVVDSLRLEIRMSLESDPYYEYSVEQFDSLCLILAEDIALRGEYLETVALANPVPAITNIEISDCLSMEEELEVTVELGSDDADGVVMLVSFNGEKEIWIHMEQDIRADRWKKEIDVPTGTYSVNMVFGPWTYPVSLPIFYPSWGMRGFQNRPSPSPAARIALAELVPELLTPEPPLWCGENLWVLPVVNSASFAQDISFCSFYLGDPCGSVFLHDSVLVQPGETFYLTNNSPEASRLFSGNIYGDAGCSYPTGTVLQLNDPSWHRLYTWDTGNGDSIPAFFPPVIPCEISMGDGPDWIEFYNPGPGDADLSGWYLMDSDRNTSLFPENTWLAPEQLLVVWQEPPSRSGGLLLDFSLNSTEDSLNLFNSTGSPVFKMGWDSSWPSGETGIIYLETPVSSINTPYSWIQELPPGTPGEANPGWEGIFGQTSLQLISENPCSGKFTIAYQCTSQPQEAIIYDMAGRMISRLELPGNLSGTLNADFTGRLPSGIYIVYLRSSTGSDSVRLTVLTEEK